VKVGDGGDDSALGVWRVPLAGGIRKRKKEDASVDELIVR